MNEDFPLEEVEIDGGIEIRQSKAVTKFQFLLVINTVINYK